MRYWSSALPVKSGAVWSRKTSLVLLLSVAGAQPAQAQPQAQVIYAGPAPWVKPPPQPTEGPTPENAPLRFVYSDTQLRVGAGGTETYGAYRVRILKPEALQMGNLSVVWNPGRGSATVHHIRIYREGQMQDVLKSTKFQIIQREGGMEQSELTGDLTGMLQVPGLQVGDELEVATTSLDRDPTLGDHAFGLFQLPSQGMPGVFRFTLSWPAAKELGFQSSRDVATAVAAVDGATKAVTYELRDPRGVIVNDGAPARYNVRRLIEYSDFSNWGDVSRRFWPLFERAANLAANSPLRARAAQIAAASQDPGERALAALRLVQDEVRYVYVGLDGGNYRPASIEETWSRRFGDCKAKTALLLALLRELDVPAEAALVKIGDDDGVDARVPSASVFNHVLVRAKINGENYWLDGTRLGDRHLDLLPQPSFNWTLPISEKGAGLERVLGAPFAHPQFVAVLKMDASAGFDQPAKVSLQYVMRGDEGFAIKTSLSALSREDADRALRAYWRQEEGWIDADGVAWSYDEQRATAVLDLTGTAKPEWKLDDDRHQLAIWGAGFAPPDDLHRAKEQDASASWSLDFPRFKCWATTIRLPKSGPKLRWDYDADPMNRNIGGVTYWRQSGLKDGVISTVMSRSVLQREITAEQAKAQVDAIPGFNNRRSQVYEVAARGSKDSPNPDPLPFSETTAWSADDAACVAKGIPSD